MGRGAGLLPPPSPPPEQREPPAERGVPSPGLPGERRRGKGRGARRDGAGGWEEEAEKAAEPWLLLCGRKVSVRLGAAAPLPVCLAGEEEETRSPYGAPPAPGHFGRGGVLPHLPPCHRPPGPWQCHLWGPGLSGAAVGTGSRARVDRPEGFLGVFSAPGAIPAERESDAEPGWAAGQEGRRAGVLLRGPPRRMKVWESSGRGIGTGAAGEAGEGAPGARCSSEGCAWTRHRSAPLLGTLYVTQPRSPRQAACSPRLPGCGTRRLRAGSWSCWKEEFLAPGSREGKR